MRDYIYQSEYLKAFVEHDVIISYWESSSEKMDMETFKENITRFAQKAQEVIQTKNVSAIVDNSHQMRFAMSPSLQVWTVRTLTPLYKQFGIRKHALVMPQSPISNMAYRQIKEEYSTYKKSLKLERGYFDSLPEAKHWAIN